MIGEDIKTEVSLEELRKITWDYEPEDAIGLYQGEVVRGFLWEVTKCGDVNPLLVSKCNVAEGWVQYIEVENPKAKTIRALFDKVKRDDDGNTIYSEASVELELNLLDAEGNVILTLK